MPRKQDWKNGQVASSTLLGSRLSVDMFKGNSRVGLGGNAKLEMVGEIQLPLFQ